MKKEDLELFLDKRIHIITKSANYTFKGMISEITDEHIKFIDKFNKLILILLDDIKFIGEIEERKNE